MRLLAALSILVATLCSLVLTESPAAASPLVHLGHTNKVTVLGVTFTPPPPPPPVAHSLFVPKPDIPPPPPPPPPPPVVHHYVPFSTGEGTGNCHPSFTYALDAETVDTPDWSCIRLGEGDSWAYGNYGLLCWPCGVADADPYGGAGAAPTAVVDEVVLHLYHENGRFSGTWNDRYTQSEGGPLR